MPDKTEKP